MKIKINENALSKKFTWFNSPAGIKYDDIFISSYFLLKSEVIVEVKRIKSFK